MDFEDLWREYERELTHFVSARLFNKSLVPDVMQEVAIKIFKHQRELTNIQNIRAWLYTLTRHTLIDFYKKNDKEIPLESYFFQVPLKEQEENELSTCIEKISLNLSQSDYTILHLSIHEEYSLKEIAKRLNLSVDGAKSRLKRAKKKTAKNFFSCCSVEKNERGNIINFREQNTQNCECK